MYRANFHPTDCVQGLSKSSRRQSAWAKAVRRGITLVELLIVITIMMMMMAMAARKIKPAVDQRRVREAAPWSMST